MSKARVKLEAFDTTFLPSFALKRIVKFPAFAESVEGVTVKVPSLLFTIVACDWFAGVTR